MLKVLSKDSAPEFAQPPVVRKRKAGDRVISSETLQKFISHPDVRRVIKHVQSRFTSVLDANVLDSCAKHGLWQALERHNFEFTTRLTSSIMRYVTFRCRDAERQQAQQQNHTSYVSRLWARKEDSHGKKAIEHPPIDTSRLTDFILDLSDADKDFFEKCFWGGYEDDELAAIFQTTQDNIIARRESFMGRLKDFFEDLE